MKDDNQLTQLASTFLKSYFTSPYQITKTKLGNANANFIVDHLNTKYFFRIYISTFDKDYVRTRVDIEKELDVINWFFERGFPVAKAIPNLLGSTILEEGNFFGVLFEYKEGGHAYGNLEPKHFFEVGKLLGKIHAETEKAQLKCDKKWKDGSFWKRVYRKIEENKLILDDKELELSSKLRSIDSKFEVMPQYLIHGDYHFANILFNKNNEISGLLDFDDYRMGHFMDDAIRSFVCELIYTPAEYYSIKKEFVDAFWDGYLQRRKLLDSEIELIPIYVDLHYISGLISLRKKDNKKAEEFKLKIDKLRSMTLDRFKLSFAVY